MQDRATIVQTMKKLIVTTLGLSIQPEDIPDDEALFGGIGANSTASLEIIFAIEETFGIEVTDDELRVELFDSVRTLADYVDQKLAAQPKPSPVSIS
ncbi:MAG: acyl carrier protein [bacterium]|nr:acyl carrier protein [bacterium]